MGVVQGVRVQSVCPECNEVRYIKMRTDWKSRVNRKCPSCANTERNKKLWSTKWKHRRK